MDRETTFWSVVTAIALAALLVLLANDKGLFEKEVDSSSEQSSNQEEPDNSGSQTALNSTADAPDPLALECLDHDGLARHDHVSLRIFIDGEQYTVESAVGIQTDVCNGNENYMHAIHTHDDSGRLHIELNEPGEISLGVFLTFGDIISMRQAFLITGRTPHTRWQCTCLHQTSLPPRRTSYPVSMIIWSRTERLSKFTIGFVPLKV